MTKWFFDQDEEVAAFTLRRIIIDGGQILYVRHDKSDDSWQFLDGENMTMKDAMLVSMGEIVKFDPTVMQIAAMLPGYYATRRSVGDEWEITKDDDEE